MNIKSLLTLALLIASCTFTANLQANLVINEFRLDQAGTDNDEYFEVYADGMPIDDLSAYWLITIGDGAGGSGVVENVTQLSAGSLAAGDFWLVAEASFGLSGTVNQTASLNFENSDNLTVMLVQDFTGSAGDDLDTDDDGVFDSTPWTTIADDVGVVETVGSGDLIYSTNLVGPNGSFAPAHVYRDVDGSGAWQIGNFDPADGGDTPGASNAAIPEPGSALILGLGALAFVRSRRRA